MRQANRAELQHLLDQVRVLPADTAVADEYGKLKHTLEMKAKLIPENDLWIAAIATHHGLPLVTFDAHFDVVDGLKVEHW